MTMLMRKFLRSGKASIKGILSAEHYSLIEPKVTKRQKPVCPCLKRRRRSTGSRERRRQKTPFRMLPRLVIYIKRYLIIFLFLNVNFSFILSIILWSGRWGCWFPQRSSVLVINTWGHLTNSALLGGKGTYLNKWTSKYAYIVALIVLWRPWSL